MPYGYIGSFTTQPGKRDKVVDILLSSLGRLREVGCAQYTVGVSDDDDVTIWVSEVWETKTAHDASLQLPEVRAAITKAMPMIAGGSSRIETSVVGGLGFDTGTP